MSLALGIQILALRGSVLYLMTFVASKSFTKCKIYRDFRAKMVKKCDFALILAIFGHVRNMFRIFNHAESDQRSKTVQEDP